MLHWLKKMESPDKRDSDWREELETALKEEEIETEPSETQERSKIKRKDVKAPWSYQSFVESEPRNFQRGKKRQGEAVVFSFSDDEDQAAETEHTSIPPEAKKLTKDTLPGRSYIEMTPTFCEVELGEARDKKLGLLDSCAQLSLIGLDTIKELQASNPGSILLHKKTLRIKGIGSSEAHHFCKLPVVIRGGKKAVRAEAEFWVVDSLNESFVLGMDFITKYGIDLHISKKLAKLAHEGEEMEFPLYFGREWREEMIRSEYTVRAKTTITVPPRTEGTVEVVVTGQDRSLPAQDLFLEPVVMSNLAMNVFATTGKGIISSKTAMVWFANMGDQPVTINRGMKIGTAVQMEGDVEVMVTEARHETGDRLETKQRSGEVEAQTGGIPKAYAARQMSEPDIWDDQSEGVAVLPDPNDRPTPEKSPRFGGFDISTEYGEDGRPPQTILDTLRELEEAFTDGVLGRVSDGTELRLETEDEKLTPQPLRHQGPRKRKVIDETIDQLLEWGIIEKSESKVSYPVVIVAQNGKNRFCVDYRSLNQWTTPMFYPMQRSDDVFDALLGKTFFSTLDALRGYHQLPVHEQDKWKTAFLTHHGLFHYNYMPFGLKNAPAVFQRFMDKILGSLRWTAALCYIDDVIIFSSSLEEHVTHIRQLLSAAIRAGLKFSKEKSHFAYSSLKMLGRRVSTEGLSILQHKLAAVHELKAPNTVKDVWHLMGLFGYYRNFIHKFSIIAAPITALTKGVKTTRKADGTIDCIAGANKVVWTKECEEAFQTLKKKLTSPPVLAYPDFKRPFILYVDASHDGMACALHQRVATAGTMDQEKECPQEGRERAATALPLLEDVGPDKRTRIIDAQKADRRWRTRFGEAEDAVTNERESDYEVVDGLLKWQNKLCLPESLMKEALSDCHDKLGHFGFENSYDKLNLLWYRPGMAKALEEYIASCRTCKGAKRSKLRPPGEMMAQRHIEPKAFAFIALDVILSMPKSRDSLHDACLVICDLFTKTVRLRPTTNKASAKDIADLVMEAVVYKGFLPTTLVSDRDPKYISAVWRAIMAQLKIELSIASPYHQQADPAERTIQTVETILRCYPDGEWKEKLNFIELAINEAKHSSTGFAPHDLLYTSRKAPSETLLKDHEETSPQLIAEEAPETIAKSKARLEEAMLNIRRAQQAQKRYYDRRHSTPQKIEVGDDVFLLLDLHPVRRLPRSKIAWPKWGPFKVTRVVSETSIEVDFPESSGVHRVVSIQHVEKLPIDRFERDQPGPVATIDGEEAYEIEHIAGRRVFGRRKDIQYLVKWKRYDDRQSQWCFYDDLALDVDAATLTKLISDWETSTAIVQTVQTDVASFAEATTTKKSEKPVLYLSRTLRSYEKNYTILELELAAVVWAILKCQRYLDGIAFTVITDHQPILKVANSCAKTLTSPRVERWRMLLQPYAGQITCRGAHGSGTPAAACLGNPPRRVSVGYR